MDRALDHEQLAEALGQHELGPLPTADELANLLAEVEVQAFIAASDVDPRVLRAAWYLHGVASAANAADRYTPERQERAFAVSAHIFDLALSAPRHTEREQLTLSFAAQVGYFRGHLDPNAVAIWRRADTLLDIPPRSRPTPPPVETQPVEDESDAPGVGGANSADTVGDGDEFTHYHFETMALRAGIAFLGLNLARTGSLLTQWRSQTSAMAETIGVENLFGTMFGPAEKIVAAVSEMVEFLRFGKPERLVLARTELRSILDRSAGSGDHDALWVAAHLLHVADGLEDSSVWSVLPSGSPDALAQAFTVGNPPVLTLWPPQRELLARTTAGPLDPDTKRLLLSVPTSAGKTLTAQIMICHHLETQTGDVCYVTSMRSLGREMRQALNSRLRVLQRGAGGDLPDFARLDLQELLSTLEDWGDNAVEIMTPERLAHMLRRDADAVLSRFSMFVIDEAHMMGQRGRGLLLETLIATLATTESRLVLLSGVMGNAAQVAAWLNEDASSPEESTQNGVLFSSTWRGPRRLHALLHTMPVWHQGTTVPRPKAKKYPYLETYPLRGELQVRPADGQTHRLYANEVGTLVRHSNGAGTYTKAPQSTAFYKQCARIAVALMHAGSLLMIVSQRPYARDAAKEIAEHLDPRPQAAELAELFSERLGEQHPLVDCVRHGVGYHHAGLPTDVLEALEQATRDEVLIALVATTTLTDGVNLPVRTVLISESKYIDQDPRMQLDAAQLLNAVGRAGRAGKETEGWIVLALNAEEQEDDFDQLRPAAEDLWVRSTLTSEVALAELAEVERLIAATNDAIFDLANTEAGNFASFVWFVLHATESVASVGAKPDIAGSIRRLLAFVQLPDDLADRWLDFAGRIETMYQQTPPVSRSRWAVAGTTLGSARTLERVAADLADSVVNRFTSTPMPTTGAPPDQTSMGATETTTLDTEQTIQLLEASNAFEALLALPECTKDWVFKATPRARDTLEVPLTDAMRHWLDGDDIPALADAILNDVADVAWRLEQTVDAVSETFEHYLSWTVGVVLEQANDMLESAGATVRFSNTFAYYIRYGVNTDQALALLTRGVRSRRLAHLVGRVAAARSLEGTEMRDWLQSLHLAGWREEFSANAREVEDLADFVRTPRTSVLRAALEDNDAKAALRYPMTPAPQVPVPVELASDAVDQSIEVWTLGQDRYRIGVISAQHHSDVFALHHSALPYSATTDGMEVKFHITAR